MASLEVGLYFIGHLKGWFRIWKIKVVIAAHNSKNIKLQIAWLNRVTTQKKINKPSKFLHRTSPERAGEKGREKEREGQRQKSAELRWAHTSWNLAWPGAGSLVIRSTFILNIYCFDNITFEIETVFILPACKVKRCCSRDVRSVDISSTVEETQHRLCEAWEGIRGMVLEVIVSVFVYIYKNDSTKHNRPDQNVFLYA